jgi:transcription initiation factor TFIID subunit 12
MENAPQARPAQAGPQQQSSLIRPEQVSRLPQLNPQQKQQYEQHVKRLWEVMNHSQQGDQRHTEAYQKLVQTSSTLMQGMKNFQAVQKRREMQQQQAAAQAQATQAAQAAQAGVTTAPSQPQPPQQPQQNSVQFSQLYPDIQDKVNQLTFYFPPAMIEGTGKADEWLREAKARYGQALQRLQVASQKMHELKRQVNERQQQGQPLTQQEQATYRGKLQQCQKAITESQNFMEKFRTQQNDFRAQQPQQQFVKQQPQQPPLDGQAPPSAGGMAQNAQGPPAHSISSAVSAARNQQAQQVAPGQAGSPTTAGAPPQPNPAASATPVKTENQEQSVFATQAQPSVMNQPIPAPQSAGARPSSQHAPHSALQQHASQQNIHAHPLSANLNTAKAPAQAITKNLQVTEPRPVHMPPSRPTLTGGAGVGLPGSLGQPAIATLPGYVLEASEDGRVLGKKKLNELVREVCGPGPEDQGEGLTPDVEEVRVLLPCSWLHIPKAVPLLTHNPRFSCK